MEYNITDFVKSLRSKMFNSFPYLAERGKNPSGSYKHGTFNDEIRKVAFDNNETMVLSDDMQLFEIGNNYAEEHYPYYHILEDAQIIRKRNRGTKQSKGSQQYVFPLSERNYNLISYNGKTFSKEYAKNYRGGRQQSIFNASRYNDKHELISGNRNSNSYYNKHYHYIEQMLEGITRDLANEYGMTLGTARNTGLMEDYLISNFELDDIHYDYVHEMMGNIKKGE